MVALDVHGCEFVCGALDVPACTVWLLVSFVSLLVVHECTYLLLAHGCFVKGWPPHQ